MTRIFLLLLLLFALPLPTSAALIREITFPYPYFSNGSFPISREVMLELYGDYVFSNSIGPAAGDGSDPHSYLYQTVYYTNSSHILLNYSCPSGSTPPVGAPPGDFCTASQSYTCESELGEKRQFWQVVPEGSGASVTHPPNMCHLGCGYSVDLSKSLTVMAYGESTQELSARQYTVTSLQCTGDGGGTPGSINVPLANIGGAKKTAVVIDLDKYMIENYGPEWAEQEWPVTTVSNCYAVFGSLICPQAFVGSAHGPDTGQPGYPAEPTVIVSMSPSGSWAGGGYAVYEPRVAQASSNYAAYPNHTPTYTGGGDGGGGGGDDGNGGGSGGDSGESVTPFVSPSGIYAYPDESGPRAQAQSALDQGLQQIRAEASDMFAPLAGSAGLPCWTLESHGQQLRLCPRDFQDKLEPVGLLILLAGAFAAAFIIFR